MSEVMSDPDFTLEDMFEKAESLKGAINQRDTCVVEFMRQKSTLKKLIDYATTIPEDPSNHTLAHKYPFVAYEVLTGNSVLVDAILLGGANESQPSDDEENFFFGAEKSRNVSFRF